MSHRLQSILFPNHAQFATAAKLICRNVIF